MTTFTYTKNVQHSFSFEAISILFNRVLCQPTSIRNVVIHQPAGRVTGWIKKKSLVVYSLYNEMYVLDEDNFFKGLEIDMPMRYEQGQSWVVCGFKIKLETHPSGKISVTFDFDQLMFDSSPLRKTVKRLVEYGFSGETPTFFDDFIKKSIADELKPSTNTQ